MGHSTSLVFCLLACLTVASWVEGAENIKARAQCPKDAVYYQQQCYQLIGVALTWEAAEIECQQLRAGSHLASFHMAAEEKLTSAHIRLYSSTTDAWIGLHAVRTSRLFWEWSNETIYTRKSILWDNRAPSTSPSTSKCIALTNIQNLGCTVRWVQCSCATALPFICKYKAS